MVSGTNFFIYIDASSRKMILNYGSVSKSSSTLYSSGSRSNDCCWDHIATSWAARWTSRSYIYQYWNGARYGIHTVSSAMERISGAIVGKNFVGTIRRLKVMPIPRGTELISYYYKDHPSCTLTQYYDGANCQPCDPSCTRPCWGPLATDCYQGSITADDIESLVCCPSKTYWDAPAAKCKDCFSRCD